MSGDSLWPGDRRASESLTRGQRRCAHRTGAGCPRPTRVSGRGSRLCRAAGRGAGAWRPPPRYPRPRPRPPAQGRGLPTMPSEPLPALPLSGRPERGRRRTDPRRAPSRSAAPSRGSREQPGARPGWRRRGPGRWPRPGRGAGQSAAAGARRGRGRGPQAGRARGRRGPPGWSGRGGARWPDGRTDGQTDGAAEASAHLRPARTQRSPGGGGGDHRLRSGGRSACPRPRPMGSQVSGAGSLSARPAGVSRWGRAGAGPGPLGAGAARSRGASPPLAAQRPPRPTPRGRPPGGDRRALALAPAALVATPARSPSSGGVGRGGRGRGGIPVGLPAEALAVAGLPHAPRPGRLLPPRRGPSPVTSKRGIFQLVISAASTPGPRRRPGGILAPLARAVPRAPRPRLRAAPGPARAELPRVGTAGGGCGRVPAFCPALGVIISP